MDIAKARGEAIREPLQVFCCYARKDQPFLFKLKKHLTPIQQEGLIILQTDIDVSPGEEWAQKITHHLNTAQIILLLVSPDFMHSDYCYSKEMMRAIERHDQREARVVPIILRPTLWEKAPFAKIQVLPTNAKPVNSKYWRTQDDAFLNVAKGIEEVVEELIIQVKEHTKKAEEIIRPLNQTIIKEQIFDRSSYWHGCSRDDYCPKDDYCLKDEI